MFCDLTSVRLQSDVSVGVISTSFIILYISARRQVCVGHVCLLPLCKKIKTFEAHKEFSPCDYMNKVNNPLYNIYSFLFFLSLQTSTQRRCKLPWPNTRRRRWPSPCLPSVAPLTCHLRLKPAHLQAGKRVRNVLQGCSATKKFSHLLLFLTQTRRRVPKTSPRHTGSRRCSLRLLSMRTCRARTLGSTAPVRARPLPPPPHPRCPTGKPSLSLSPSRSTNRSISPCISLSTSLSTNVTTSSTSSLQLQ